MQLDELKIQLGLLLSAAADWAASNGAESQRLCGTALYDSQKDGFIASLEPFAAVEAGIRGLALVHERYGIDQSRRIALQLVYEYFTRAKVLSVDSASVDTLWSDFITELETPVWLMRCVTNLRNFHSEYSHIELGDGVFIYGRDPVMLAGLGFGEGILDRLFADWNGFGASSFVLVTESSIPKRPSNLIKSDDESGGWLRCARTIGAMRLIAPGDVGIGTVFLQRVARFNVGIGGIYSVSCTVDTPGNQFSWRPEHCIPFGTTYNALARLEKDGYDKAPGNLDLALRAFMSTFDRFPAVVDTKLVDAITALEAVLGTKDEVTFKLSFRVASLLAATDEQRSALLNTMKAYYDVRSRIVHGDHLKEKHKVTLATVDELRNIVRRLLRSFVLFGVADIPQVNKTFFDEELDAALVDNNRREGLRKLLGLTET